MGTFTGKKKEEKRETQTQKIVRSHKELEQSDRGADNNNKKKNSRDAQVRPVNGSTPGCTHRCAHTWMGGTESRERVFLLLQSASR